MSTERKITCFKCSKYVGVIRDARIIKGLAFICPACQEMVDDPFKAQDKLTPETEPFLSNDMMETFTDIFGDLFNLKPKK